MRRDSSRLKRAGDITRAVRGAIQVGENDARAIEAATVSFGELLRVNGIRRKRS